MSVNAFSVGLSVTVGGITVDESDIISMKLVRSSENPPVKGVVSSVFIISARMDDAPSPNGEVNVSITGEKSMSFCTHFISSISRKGSIVTVRAYDRMRKTDIAFDDSRYNEGDAPFDATLLIADLAEQCGFEGSEIPQGFGKFRWGDMHGKKCREILDLVAEVMCGVWWCSDDNELRFTPFLSQSCGIMVNEDNSSPLYIHSVKGPFTAVLARNTSDGNVYSAGSGGDIVNILRLQGRLFTHERTQAIMSDIAQKCFTAFYCGHGDIGAAPCGITAYSFGEKELIAVKNEVFFGGGGVYAKISAADICEDEEPYLSLMDYEDRKKIEEGRYYGSTVMTEKGIGILSTDRSEDVREQEIYCFSDAISGVTEFEGAVVDSVLPQKIEKLNAASRKIIYGGVNYILSWRLDEQGNKVDFNMERGG